VRTDAPDWRVPAMDKGEAKVDIFFWVSATFNKKRDKSNTLKTAR